MASLEKIQKNLSDIERKLTKAGKIASKGSDIKLGDAIKLGSKNNAIVSTIKKGVKEYSSFDPNEEQAKAILQKMRTIVNLTETYLNLLVEHKARFESLHVGGLVKKNMAKSDEAGTELAAVMLQKAPQSIKAESEALDKRRVAAFKKAVAAFANSSGGEDKADEEDDSD